MSVESYSRHLQIIQERQKHMENQVVRWSCINSHTYNLEGIEKMLAVLRKEFEVLAPDEFEFHEHAPQRIINSAGLYEEVALGRTLCIRKFRPEKPRVLLAIHTDTVFPRESEFQNTNYISPDRLQGPGVIDAKGGIAIILGALMALEAGPFADNVSWEVLLNPDEEIGSPGSAELLGVRAREFDLGLLFEPALPDGALVAARRGSGSFSAVLRGRSAHVGREYHLGRNAVVALSQVITELDRLNENEHITINMGRLEGGGPVNVVPDLAIVHFNVRITSLKEKEIIQERLKETQARVNAREGYSLEFFGEFLAPPKPFTGDTVTLYHHLKNCAADLDLALPSRDTGGVCDGNRLAARGLPNIDTLGARGAGAHSPQEFLELKSLGERARLTALFLMKLGAGEINFPRRVGPGVSGAG